MAGRWTGPQPPTQRPVPQQGGDLQTRTLSSLLCDWEEAVLPSFAFCFKGGTLISPSDSVCVAAQFSSVLVCKHNKTNNLKLRVGFFNPRKTQSTYFTRERCISAPSCGTFVDFFVLKVKCYQPLICNALLSDTFTKKKKNPRLQRILVFFSAAEAVDTSPADTAAAFLSGERCPPRSVHWGHLI